MHEQFGEDRTCSSEDVIATDKHRQADRHAHHNTPLPYRLRSNNRAREWFDQWRAGMQVFAYRQETPDVHFEVVRCRFCLRQKWRDDAQYKTAANAVSIRSLRLSLPLLIIIIIITVIILLRDERSYRRLGALVSA